MVFIGRRRFVVAAMGLGASLAYPGRRALDLSVPKATSHKSFGRTSYALGTKLSITVLESDQRRADMALDAAFVAIEEVETQLSIYRPESQLSRLNRTGYLAQPHPDLLSVLECAAAVSQQSQGAFDITVQPLWEQFAATQKSRRLPTSEELAKAQRRVDWRRVQVNCEGVRLLGQGTKITLNGIAQGYAGDRALAALRQHGIEHALIDTGELAAMGSKPQEGGWKVGVQHPREPEAFTALAKLEDRCLSTSGDYATTFTDDRRVHHVFDPATGTSPQELASVSVVAPTAMQADAWSTAMFVLGVKRSAALIESLPGLDALFVLKDGRTLATPGFPFVEGAAS